jgi:ABC-type sugar transport system ATPase subunit
MMALKSVLQVKDLSKSFGNVDALRKVNLNFFEGEIHAVLGQNGAGKSTLIKLITGLYETSSASGTLILNGDEIQLHSVSDARQKGIGYVPQEIEIVDTLTVAENIFAGNLPTNKGVFSHNNILKLAQELVDKYELNLPVGVFAASLSTAQRQTTMIARALASNPAILLLDEPTTSLSKEDAQTLAKTMVGLRDKNVTMIYITHRIPEVLNLCDRATVLRDGQVALELSKSEFSTEKIISSMIGKSLNKDNTESHKVITGRNILTLEDIHVPRRGPQSVSLSNVNLTVREGEILGLGGLVGSGRTEVLDLISGRTSLASGKITLSGEVIVGANPQKMRDRGIIYLTEDRKREGLLFNLNLIKNTTAGSLNLFSKFGLLDERKESEIAVAAMKSLTVKTNSYAAEPSHLSGGNQQKVLLARALISKPKILLLDEPTKGVDVGARQEIYEVIRRIQASGTSVIVVASDLDELLSLANRVVVMAGGKSVDEFERVDGDEARILKFGTGVLS